MQIFYVQPEKLWSRYLLAAALIVMLVVTSHVVGQIALSGSPEAAAAINMSGRQRMLAYKIARLAGWEAEKRDAAEAQPITESLDEALQLFKDSHYALYEGLGDGAMTVRGAAQRRRIYEQRVNGKSLDQHFSEYVDLIERTRRGDPDAFAELETLKTVDILFEHLDRAVHALEDQAANRTQRASLVSDLSLTAALIVLVLEALFIFWPAQRTVTQSIRDLKKSNEALSQSKRELQSALGDADIARSHVEHLLEMRTTEAWQAATEISMPLASIDASLRSIRSEGLTPEEARELMDSKNAVRRIRRILEEGFDRRRDETRLEAANTASTNIRLFADALGNMAEVWTRGRPVKIRTECADTVPEHLMLD
ncbi:MAG: type IV pili methyl-accepting chemotaxis transducer N-terminal domain-containing protein, partial [Pseudomonadota bacterium]